MAHRFQASDIIRILTFSALFGLARAVFCSLWRNDSLIPEPRIFFSAAILCIIVTLLFYSLIRRRRERSDLSEAVGKLPSVSRVHFFILFLLVYTIALLTWFPGTTYYDTLQIFFNRMTMMTQFPPIYCLWITLLADLGRAVHYPRLTMILLSITQILTVSAMMAQICHWIWRKKLPNWLKISAVLFCIFNPLYSMYAIAAIKDTLSSLALVVIMTVLYDMAVEGGEEKAENWVILALCMAFPPAFRSNGFFIILILLIAMFFRFRKSRKRILLLFLELLLIRFAEKLLYWRFGVTPFIQEALAIPLQQLCAVVAWNGYLTPEQAAFINNLLPLDTIREAYDPSFVDPIKWHSEFGGAFLRDNLPGFFRIWFEVMLNNFWIYVKAYLLHTIGYWAPANLGTTKFLTEIDGIHRSYLADNNLVTASVWGNGPLQTILERYYRSAAYLPSEGVWVWLMFFCAFLRNLVKKDRQTLLIFSPCLLCWISLMLAVPVWSETRYALCFFYGIPIFLSLAAL